MARNVWMQKHQQEQLLGKEFGYPALVLGSGMQGKQERNIFCCSSSKRLKS